MSSPPVPGAASSKPSFGGRWTYAIVALALLFVLMPFLFWRATWFGRSMTDAQLQKALGDGEHPREIQHALSQIADRILRGDPTVARWYPDVVRLSSAKQDEIRLTTAWVMGQDNSVAEFHEALLRLLADPQPMVERNAALALVRFRDTSGHAAILAMLQAYALPASVAGRLSQRLKIGDVVNPGTMVAHIEAGGKKTEVRTTVPGTIVQWTAADGTDVAQGQPLLLLSPSEEMVKEALRALFLIGQPGDLALIAPYAGPAGGLSPELQRQAIETERAIEKRAGP